jgi:hypothetical protein
MHRKSLASGTEDVLREEAVHLRIHQLQMGLLQFTDSTTAYRMLTKYGTDIR